MSTPTIERDSETTPKQSLTHRLYTGDISYDFIGRRKLWYIVSGILLLIAVVAILVRGLDLGIEFRGGSDFQASMKVTSTTVTDYRNAVLATGVANLDSTVVTTIGDNKVRVQTRALSVPEQTTVRAAIATKAGVSPDEVAYQLIGASWGKQITQQAAIALVVFLVLVGLLIWIYFRDAKMSVAALVALAHDLIITIGVYALVGFTVTPATMIGVLTILGYSLYDTVVVFDKVRENVAALETNKVTYTEAANHAVNQVLVRSLNTTVIGVLPVAAILFAGVFVLGSGPLEDLGLALFVGMIAGAYSSIFIATPLLAQLREREPEMTAHRERVERRRRAAEQRASFKGTTVDIPAMTIATAATAPASAITVTTVAAPKPSVKVDEVVEPENAEVVDAVEADVEETDSPASDKVAPAATTRNQSSKQTRTRRKR
ncbi:MAG: protein translocase subunit SecF [Propionibacteriaceae bacterium]